MENVKNLSDEQLDEMLKKTLEEKAKRKKSSNSKLQKAISGLKYLSKEAEDVVAGTTTESSFEKELVQYCKAVLMDYDESYRVCSSAISMYTDFANKLNDLFEM